MPDIQSLVITAQGAANVNVPRFTVACRVTDSITGATVADFTGANALVWPGVLASLTATQRREVLRQIMALVLYMRAGLA